MALPVVMEGANSAGSGNLARALCSATSHAATCAAASAITPSRTRASTPRSDAARRTLDDAVSLAPDLVTRSVSSYSQVSTSNDTWEPGGLQRRRCDRVPSRLLPDGSNIARPAPARQNVISNRVPRARRAFRQEPLVPCRDASLASLGGRMASVRASGKAWRTLFGIMLGLLGAVCTWRLLTRQRASTIPEGQVTSPPRKQKARKAKRTALSHAETMALEAMPKAELTGATPPPEFAEDRVTFRIPLITSCLIAIAVLVAGSTAMRWSPLPTTASFAASTLNGVGFVQAGTLRLESVPGASPAFTVPALLPGESVERVYTITHGGSTDASLTLDVVPATRGRLTLDPESGLQVDIARCDVGAWVAGSGTSGLASYECVATNGGIPTAGATVYQGPLVPRVNPASSVPASIPIVARVAPGATVSVRVRASLPIGAASWAQDVANTSADRTATVSLDWRANPISVNLAGNPLATHVSVPFQSTPLATTVPIPPAPTALPPAPTMFPEPTATVQPLPEGVVTGYSGYALALDGVGDALELGGAPVSLANHDAWTIEAWVRPNSLVGAQAMYTENVAIANGAAGMVLGLGLMDRQVVVGGWSDSSATQWTWSEAPLPAGVVAGTWFHLAATRSGTTVTIFVNGSALPSGSLTGAGWASLASAVPSTFYVGRAANPGEASYFQGQIDEIRLWTVARSASQVSISRRQRLWGTETGLVASMPVSGYPATSADGHGTSILNQVTGSYTGLLRGGMRFVPSGADITLPPTPSDLSLAPASDSGTKGDSITNAASASIVGLAEAGSVVTLFRDEVPVSSTLVASSNGTFTVSVTMPSDASYAFTATSANAEGAAGLQSKALVVLRDATPPPAPTAIALATGSDSFGVGTAGTASDRVTNVTKPTIVGRGEAGSAISVYDNATEQTQTVSVGADGSWSWSPVGSLADGSHSISAKSIDVAGNVSAESVALLIVIDTSVATPSISLASGGVATGDSTPTITISGEPGSLATLTIDSSVLSTVVLVNGSAAIDVRNPLTIGQHSASVNLIDPAGNVSLLSTMTFSVVASTMPTCAATVAASSSSGQVAGSVAANQANCVTLVASGASLTVDTCLTSASTDTWIEVYDAFSIRIGLDDDSCGSLRSTLTVPVVPQQPYTIIIRGYAWRSLGAYILRWQNKI